MLRAFVAVAVLAASATPPAGRTRVHRYEGARESMACLYVIDAYGPDGEALPGIVEGALDEVDRIDRLMSGYRVDSPLSRINRDAARAPVTVEPELFDFIADAVRYSHASSGAFDITVGPLMKAWGFFDGDGALPSPERLSAARALVGAGHVRLDPLNRTVAFSTPGVELDLGGIAKGYAVDRAAALLRRGHVAAASVSSGGSTIYAFGSPPGREAWEIDIEDPTQRGKVAMKLRLKDRALSVAGRSEKSFTAGGVTYSHVMDPRTGWPAQGVLSVAVLAATGTAGDALDDALFVLGPEGSRSYLEQVGETEAFFFLPQGAGGWTMRSVGR